jgi:hypothetical protein
MKTPSKAREARTAQSRRSARDTAGKPGRASASPSGMLRRLRELLSAEHALPQTTSLRRFHD